jgi:type I restriction enzyme S subunit
MTLKQISIGEIVDREEASIQTGPFGTQLKASHYTEEGWPVINVRNVGYGDLRPEKLEFINEETRDRLSVHVLEEQDIVFGRKVAVDRHLFVKSGQSGWLQGSDCIRLRFSSPRIEPRFVSYAFLTQSHQSWMLTQSGNKATMASLNQDIIKRIEIPDLPRVVQTRIADILSAYDDLIENNKRRMQLLEEAAQQLYREWFVRLRFPGHEHTKIINGLPEGWDRKPLGGLCSAIKDTVQPKNVEQETPYIGLEHIPRRSISLSEWGAADAVTSTKYQFSEGDILFGKIRPYFHKVGTAFVSGITSSDAIVVRSELPAHQAILLCLMSSDEFVADTAQSMREGSKMPRADWKLMQQFPVLVPKPLLLEAFSETINSIISQLKTLTFQNQKLRSARDLLLPKLMNGEIEV